MYKNLRTNTPRQTIEYVSFPFPEDTPSYPTSTCVHRYLKNFTKHFGIDKHMLFRSLVTRTGQNWNVTYHKTDSRTNQTDACSFLIVASGINHTPKMPSFEGLNTFRGKVIHSHDYKNPEVYKNRRVLIAGAGASGLDLAIQLSNVTSKLVHSHHLVYNEPYFGPTYVKKPDIKMFTNEGVLFKDETFEKVDDVIFCTGFIYSYKFLDNCCGISVSNSSVLPLYQHVVNIIYPTMLFIGVSKKAIDRVYDSQAQYAAALIAGKFELPSQDDMLKLWWKQVHSLQQKNTTINDVNVVGKELNNYLASVTLEANLIPVPPVITEIEDYEKRYEYLLHFKDYEYRLLDDYHYERLYNPRKKLSCPIEDIEDL